VNFDTFRDEANVQAFLCLLRIGETNLTDDAYRMISGGGLFDAPPWEHPYKGLSTLHGGKAAGFVQYIPHTWDGCVKDFGLEDFSPVNQERAAIGLISQHHGALSDVLAGRVADAIGKLNQVWVSLPGAPGIKRTIEEAEQIFVKYGGTLAGAAPAQPPIESILTPPPEPEPLVTQPEDTTVDPLTAISLISTIGPYIVNLIPQVKKLFDPGVPVAERNVNAAVAVLQTISEVAKEQDVRVAVTKMQADPALRQEVTNAVLTHPEVVGLLEVGGGIVKAREYGLQVQNAEKPFWYNPVFVVTCMFMPAIFWMIGSIIVAGVELRPDAPWWADTLIKLFGTAFTPETRAGLFNLVVGMIVGGVCGVWYGTSVGSMKKDDRPTTNATAKE
jgi:muramidase (phage lysozyme)